MSHHELINAAKNCRPCRTEILALADSLPPEDAVLESLMAEAVSKRDELVFRSLVLAALCAARPVRAELLVEGAALLGNPIVLSRIAFQCQGNVADALVAAVRHGHMGIENEAIALLIAAQWCADEPGRAVPKDIIPLARTMARRTDSDIMTKSVLWCLAKLLSDDGLTSVVRSDGFEIHPQTEDSIRHVLIDDCRKHPLDSLPEKPPPTALSGFTMRRSVPRLGRNDPCHCGSGKKYKRCCLENDQERLMHSSSVEGLTREELREKPEAGLDEMRLREMSSYELFNLDLHKVPPELRGEFLDQMLVVREYDRVVEALETWEFEHSLNLVWEDLMFRASELGRIDWIERLVDARDDKEFDPEIHLSIGARLLLADKQGKDRLQMIEQHLRNHVETTHSPDIAELAYGLMEGATPILGIHIARSLIAVGSLFESDMLCESILETRDKLGLSPTDPAEQLLNERYREGDFSGNENSQELGETRRKLDAKTDEMRGMARELESLRKELEILEKRREPESHTTAQPVAVEAPKLSIPDEKALHELRNRVHSLKDLLKERHAERNQLRRELQSARREIDSLNVKKEGERKTTDGTETDKSEDALLSDALIEGNQPPRLPLYSKQFTASISHIPESVRRAALLLIGRLGAGDLAAFHGVKQLKALPQIYRQRVGGDFRLLFRLSPTALEIVDLINRRDLERRIRTMS